MRAFRQPSCTTHKLAPEHRGLANGSPVCAGITASDGTLGRKVSTTRVRRAAQVLER